LSASTEHDLGVVRESHRRLADWLAALDRPDPSAPSRLDGWSIGHVMTHVARNADGFTRMVTAAGRGEVAQQYEGGRAGRQREIDDGAVRDWADLVADVVASGQRLENAFAAASDDVWATGTGELLAGTEPVSAMPHRRVREVEIHRIDLGLGASFADWTDAFVVAEWPLSLARLPARLPADEAVRLEVDGAEAEVVGDGATTVDLFGTRQELLAWMTGRLDLPNAPALTSWP
jgi:maleylpyruvate isomerase